MFYDTELWLNKLVCFCFDMMNQIWQMKTYLLMTLKHIKEPKKFYDIELLLNKLIHFCICNMMNQVWQMRM